MKREIKHNIRPKGRILFAGHCYYNTWYLSRELRKMGWKADTLNFDFSEENQIYYHGEDYRYYLRSKYDFTNHFKHLWFYIKALFKYDIFHFSGSNNINICLLLDRFVEIFTGKRHFDVKLLKLLGKKIVYSNNGCLDGVTKSSFATWGDTPVCNNCRWRDNPMVCSDERVHRWGRLRNSIADYQITVGGNRKDYNDDPRVHEVPEFYCLDSDFWNPDLLIPSNYRLPLAESTVKIYHAVGNYSSRTEAANNNNIKSTHIYIPLVDRLKSEGYDVELIFFNDVPNRKIRYYQAQADIVVDMLTFGFFGANIREAMMLGKPCICYLRPEWLESMRQEIPEYVEELPVISATPESVREILIDLVEHPEKRREIGEKSRQFSLKWHSAEAGAKRISVIYEDLLRKTRIGSIEQGN